MVDVLQADLISSPARHRMSDRVADDLFRLIVTLQLKPGSILNETALMQHLQCGRTPLREALIALERQYLIKIVPRQATMVTEITLVASSEIYEALRCVEGPLARLAAERITGGALHGLDEDCVALETLPPPIRLSPDHLYRLADLDFDFHAIIARAAANQFLMATLDGLRGSTMRLMCVGYRQAEVLLHAVAEHRIVLEALNDGNADAAERAMQAHADASKRRMFEQAAGGRA
jgi:DNA-binding GntR family transcriptional regulator